MKIERYNNIDKLANLYFDFLYEIYGDRCIATISRCKEIVQEWITAKVDVFGLLDSDTLVGFSLAYVDTNSGTLKPSYRAEITYVIPEYRKTRWSYRLLKLPIDMAQEVGMPVVSKSTVHNKVNNMHRKFGGQLIFEERIL